MTKEISFLTTLYFNWLLQKEHSSRHLPCPVHTVCKLLENNHTAQLTCPELWTTCVNWLLQNDHTAVLSCPKCMSTDYYRMTTQLSRPVQNVCQLTVTEWPHSCPVLSKMYVNWLLQNGHTAITSYPVHNACQLFITEWTHSCLFLSPLYINWLLQNEHTSVFSCHHYM